MPFGTGKEEEQSRKLFIGGMSHETTDETLRSYFEKYGDVCDSVVIKEKGSDRSKGFGFVTYQTEEEADACMNERPHFLDERQIDVKRAVSREESSKPGAHVQVKKIFIGGIRECVDKDSLYAYFSDYGSIVSCEIPMDNDQQRPKGFAFITFNDFDPVDKLVAKRHHRINGVRCEVKKALSKLEMEKARYQLDTRQRSGDYGRFGSRGRLRGSFRERDPYSGSSYMRRSAQGRGDYYYRGGYDDYNYGCYDDVGYGSSYGNGYSSYGPIRNQGSSQRSRRPYHGSYSGSYGGYDDHYDNYDYGYDEPFFGM